MNLANEVSALETQLANALSENDILKKNREVMEFENDHLKRALAKTQAERDSYLRRAEGIKSLLDQTGATLITGINKFHESERHLQEMSMGMGNKNEPPPKFISDASRKLADSVAVG